MNNKRIEWIDIARAILIVFVILGHSTSGLFWQCTMPQQFVYFFHMPAFFIISGLLYKPVENKYKIKDFILKRIKRLLIPYVSYLLLCNIILYGIKVLKHKFIFSDFKTDFFNSIFGGVKLNTNYGILWFLTCLFVIEIIWILIDTFIKTNIFKIVIIALFYILAHVQAWLLPNLSLPFAIEISLICISYYCFGVYFKEYILAKKAVIISYFITIAFAFLRGLDVTQYGFELYRHHYTDIILDFIIPISLSITLFSVCKLISTKKISQYVSYIGTITLPIMCLHIIINWFVGRFLEYGWLMFVIIGFIIPVLIAKFVFEKSKLLSILFLGKMQ